MNDKTSARNTLLLLLLLGLPNVALANAGTPLGWGTMAHLTVGNIVIGILEGLLVRWFIKSRGISALGTMILANFLSAICGIACLALLSDWFQQWTLLNLRCNFLLLVVALWLLTIVLELPFVWYAMGKELCGWWRALICSLFIQSVSYLLLVGWYLFCGNNSLLTCKLVNPEEIEVPADVCVYYIDADDNRAYRMRPSNWKPERISEERFTGERVRLMAIQDDTDTSKANLVVASRHDYRNHCETKVLFSRFAEIDKAVVEKPMDKSGRYDVDDYYQISRPLGGAIDSDVRFRRHWYGEFGLDLLRRTTNPPPGGKGYHLNSPDRYGFNSRYWQKERKLFALASPIAYWWMAHIIQFPNDIILFEMTNKQLCLFDYKTNRIALLSRGFGATATQEKRQDDIPTNK